MMAKRLFAAPKDFWLRLTPPLNGAPKTSLNPRTPSVFFIIVYVWKKLFTERTEDGARELNKITTFGDAISLLMLWAFLF